MSEARGYSSWEKDELKELIANLVGLGEAGKTERIRDSAELDRLVQWLLTRLKERTDPHGPNPDPQERLQALVKDVHDIKRQFETFVALLSKAPGPFAATFEGFKISEQLEQNWDAGSLPNENPQRAPGKYHNPLNRNVKGP